MQENNAIDVWRENSIIPHNSSGKCDLISDTAILNAPTDEKQKLASNSASRLL